VVVLAEHARWRRPFGYFERALAIDPNFAAAHAGLADAWSVLGFYSIVRPSDAFGKARRAAREALALAPDTADSYASLAYVRMYHDWRWVVAASGAPSRSTRATRRHISGSATCSCC
jgi:tetratricopeptide (TPR) repeat protein